MSIKQKIRNLAKKYNQERAKLAVEEADTLCKMVNILEKSNRPLSARQIATKLDFDMTTHEIASNLLQMNYGGSRYFDKGTTASIARKVRHNLEVMSNVRTFIEVDEHGQPLKGGSVIKRKGSNSYGLKEKREK